MTKEELLQKSIECADKYNEMCFGMNCEVCVYSNDNILCTHFYFYERGFAAGIEEGRRMYLKMLRGE